MPPKFRFTREEIVDAALALTAEGGAKAVTARALAAKLGSSAKPIFGLFENMEELQRAVLAAAFEKYSRFIAAEMTKGEYAPYKASGMAYIRFAKEERELFKLLFMRDRSREEKPGWADVGELIGLIQKGTGLSREAAQLFHLEMWVYVHGIAAMIATAYLDFDEETVSRMLSDMYWGLRSRSREEWEGSGAGKV